MDPAPEHKFMLAALEEARHAAAEGEVPVGAVVAVGGSIAGAAHNRPIALRDPTAHAEVLALRVAADAGTYRLGGAVIYVTIEPCVMCIGAILNARIARIYYGARDEKAGALGSVYDIGRDGRLNHRVEVYGGIMERECAEIMRAFFTQRRLRP
ncbi:MAG: tRNA adenosine(34) deaminase TadA [Candidatus Binataceae bacterium]